MARLGQTFNPDEVPAGRGDGFDIIPAGRYTAQIIETDVVEAKSGRGQLINLTWEILDGPHENRRIWSRVNFLHENQDAQEIGQRFLKRITDALGIGPFDDTDVLTFKPVLINVGIEKSRDANYPDRNEVKNVMPLGGNNASAPARQPAAQASPASTATPAATTAPPAKPWERKRVA